MDITEAKRVSCHHFLFNSSQGRADTERVSGQHVLVELPLVTNVPGLFVGVKRQYEIPVDERDKRTLVAFDGHIPWGGLPKKGAVVYAEKLGTFEISAHHVRLRKEYEELPPPMYVFDNEQKLVQVCMDRYFLLLPQSRTVVRRYTPESLDPRYLIVEVDRGNVVWQTSSY
jgi:hypothetical protein